MNRSGRARSISSPDDAPPSGSPVAPVSLLPWLRVLVSPPVSSSSTFISLGLMMLLLSLTASSSAFDVTVSMSAICADEGPQAYLTLFLLLGRLVEIGIPVSPPCAPPQRLLLHTFPFGSWCSSCSGGALGRGLGLSFTLGFYYWIGDSHVIVNTLHI